MRAVAITDDRSVAVVDIDRPVPGVGEVLLDVRYCGICGSDLHMLGMPAEMIPAGHVLGHEFTGVVAGLGPGVDGWDAGERVTVFPMISCGQCYACRTGHLNLCEKGIDHGPGIGRQGGYAESVVVPAGMLRRLPGRSERCRRRAGRAARGRHPGDQALGRCASGASLRARRWPDRRPDRGRPASVRVRAGRRR
jgi:threonine dehydrogenase-like Zn-dependent dehydrogenase